MNNIQPQQYHDGNMRQLAHDLRNCMGVIYGNMQLLEVYLREKDMEKELNIVGKVLRETAKMNALITRELFDSGGKNTPP